MIGQCHCLDCHFSWAGSTADNLCPACLMRLGLGEAQEPGAGGRLGEGEHPDPPSSPTIMVADSVRLEPRGGRHEGAVSNRIAPHLRLDLLDPIAHGGTGVVFRGLDERLGRDVAVKVLLPKHLDVPQVRRRFAEEAQITGQLQHPGIVPIYESGMLEGVRPYIVMKLIQGRTLSSLLRRRPDPAHERARFIAIFLHVCRVIAYAHSRGVVHRDLKPSNIMIGRFGEIFVMDWGMAKVLGGPGDGRVAATIGEVRKLVGEAPLDPSRTLTIFGTPAYMAPEQAAGKCSYINERADLFGLGSLLCEILTGKPAYVGDTAEEIYGKAVLGETEDALARLEASQVGADLIAMARDCLSAEPGDRPENVGEVTSRLETYLSLAALGDRAEFTQVRIKPSWAEAEADPGGTALLKDAEVYRTTFRIRAVEIAGEPRRIRVRGDAIRARSGGDMAAAVAAGIGYDAEMNFTGDASFREEGIVRFGGADSLRIGTRQDGLVTPGANPGQLHGAVIWHIEAGTGRFERAAGLVTTNFVFDPATGEGIEEQVGVIFRR